MNADSPAFMASDQQAPAPEAPHPSPLAIGWRVLSGAFVFLIVAWHLFFLVVRNPLDFWYKPIKEWCKGRLGTRWDAGAKDAFELADQSTYRFANMAGCEQRWVMFSPPMAKRAPFLTARFEFTDGSVVYVYSENEPDPARFFRVGGWQMRKYEDYIMDGPNSGKPEERVMWSAYIRHKVRDWKRRYPDDPRELGRVVILKRYLAFPGPDEPLGAYRIDEEREVAAFTPEGVHIP